VATKKQEVDELARALRDLQGQQDALIARIVALEDEQEAIEGGDAVDVEGVVARLGEIDRELESGRRILPMLASRVVAVREQHERALADYRESTAKKLRPREAKAIDVVVGLVDKLEAALLDVQGIERELRDLRVMPYAQIPNVLWQSVRACQDHWRTHGSNHGVGGAWRKEHREQVHRWEAGIRDPLSESFVKLMSENKEARQAHEKRTGTLVKGKYDDLRVERDPRAVRQVWDTDGKRVS